MVAEDLEIQGAMAIMVLTYCQTSNISLTLGNKIADY